MSVLMLQELHKHVIEHGVFDERYLADPKMTRQEWKLDDLKAFIDGDVIGLESPTMLVTQTFDHPPLYWKGSEFELVLRCRRLMPDQFPSHFR